MPCLVVASLRARRTPRSRFDQQGVEMPIEAVVAATMGAIFLFVGIALGIGLVIYAVYYIFFKLGK
jgi:hypothetical protein